MSQGFPPAQPQWGGQPQQWQQPQQWTAPAQPNQAQWNQTPGNQPQWNQPQGHPPLQGQPPQPWPTGTPKGRRGGAPVVLAALLVVAAVMVGFILYSLFSGPDYQNDDYHPPPPGPTAPLPDIRYSEIDQILNENPLYAQTLPVPVRCELSNPEINLDTATDAAVHAHLDEVMACLMRVWEPPFRGTGRFEAHRPVVNVYQDQIATPCGAQNDPSAFYCMVNQQIYLSRQYGETHPNLAALPKPRVVDAVMAHEFGHAMQGRNGILLARIGKSQNLDKTETLDLSRRVEAQADCFSGMYFQSVQRSIGLTKEQLDMITEYRRLVGSDELMGHPDDPNVVTTHPHGRSRVYWFQTGLTSQNIGACNTFTAPAEHVR